MVANFTSHTHTHTRCILICRCMQNHNDERTQFFRKIYLTLLKGLCVRGSWRPNKDCNILTPTLLVITAFLSRSPGLLNRGPRGPASLGHGSHSSIFSPTELNFLLPELYNNLTSTYFLRASQFRTQFNPSTVKVTPDLLISSTGRTCYLHRCSSFDCLAGVNMQHTHW